MRNIFILSLCLISILPLRAQDKLLQSLNDSLGAAQKTEYVSGAFKALYLVNMQTTESPAAGALNVEIQHRFGALNSGAYEFFGLDNATLRLGLDYGITDRLSVGVGRSSYQKTFDSYFKYKLLRQTRGSGGMPLTASVLATMSYFTQHFSDKPYLNGTYRIAYCTQLLLTRKFSGRFSLELSPVWLHYNYVPKAEDNNNVFALAGGARMKISKRMSINAEYSYLFPGQVVSTPAKNAFSLGWDIETGGHVFQLVFSNAQTIIPTQYIAQTLGSWGNGDIYFGFNISRNFNLRAHK